MAGRHVVDDLSRHCEGEMPEAEARRIEDHLAACAECRQAEAEVRRGLRLAASLPRVELPEAVAARIWQALEQAPLARRPARRLWPAAAAAAALVAAVLATRFDGRGRETSTEPSPSPETGGLVLHLEPGPPTAFEQAAFDLHSAHADGRMPLDVRTSSVREVRRWSEHTVGLGVSLAVERPPEDAGHFVLEGARVVRVGEAKALAVAYRVDGRPVTLLTTRAEDAPGRSPEWTAAGKRVRSRETGGRKLLTWTNSDQTYALVSDLPGYGQRSCLLCHTTPARREAIRALRPSAASSDEPSF
jgi:anti-sigma factor RsiW